MSDFQIAWLDAREPLDHAVRSEALAARFAARLGDGRRLLDLGSGTGSNIRYLAPRLGRLQRWTALDRDPALLEALGRATPGRGGEAGVSGDPGDRTIQIAPRLRELRDLDQLSELEACDALTASALLDLVSARWLDDLADRLAAAALPALFALSFDGRMTFTPERAEDSEVRACFVRHQRTDKGFGPALGADAVGHLAAALAARGRTVDLARSDWRLGPACRALTLMFLDGLRAVLEQASAAGLGRWLAGRLDDLESERLEIVVGHQDLLVL